MIQCGSKTIKGYVDSPEWGSIEKLLNSAFRKPSEIIRVHSIGSNRVEEVSVEDIKAVFYVNSFEGDPAHHQLNFYNHAPVIEGIWMRVQFLDGEILEGIVHNSIHYLVDPGFFLLPTDPESNNQLVYVRKSQLAGHCVLGLRKL